MRVVKVAKWSLSSGGLIHAWADDSHTRLVCESSVDSKTVVIPLAQREILLVKVSDGFVPDYDLCANACPTCWERP